MTETLIDCEAQIPRLAASGEILPAFCPLWTNITKRRTTCLKEGCTKYIPPDELENGDIIEGLCSDIVAANCLGSISLSLAILAGQVEMKYKDDETVAENNKSEESLYG